MKMTKRLILTYAWAAHVPQEAAAAIDILKIYAKKTSNN
jgi:hypothetical protein